MCGRFRLEQKPQVIQLLEHLGNPEGELRYLPDAMPGSRISIITEGPHGRRIQDAIWSLLLDENFKPSRQYSTFNSRSDKLNVTKSLAYHPFRKTRCIIPATAFIEGLGDSKTYHAIENQDGSAIAFGGLYRQYVHRDTDEVVFGASIITLGPIPQWSQIHTKAFPLMLPPADQALIDDWLSPNKKDVESFESILQPALRIAQRITPIERPSRWNPIGDSFALAP